MKENTKTELGAIQIHRNVISSITIEAAREIPGVSGIGTNLKSNLLGILGKKDTSAIKIEFDANNDTTITVPIIVKYGYNIPEIAQRVQDNIKAAIENATNIDISNINIIIQEIEQKNQPKIAAEEPHENI